MSNEESMKLDYKNTEKEIEIIKSLNKSKDKIFEMINSPNGNSELIQQMWEHLKKIDEYLIERIPTENVVHIKTHNIVIDIRDELREIKKSLKQKNS